MATVAPTGQGRSDTGRAAAPAENKLEIKPDTKMVRRSKEYVSGFAAALIPLPVVAATGTAGLYLLPRIPEFQALPMSWYAIMLAWGFTFIAWLVFAGFLAPFAVPERADPRNYQALRDRQESLDQRLARLNARLGFNPTLGSAHTQNDGALRLPAIVDTALAEANAYQRLIDASLQSRAGLRWLSGKGYQTIWTQICRVEESLIEADPDNALATNSAIRDRQRLEDSPVSNRAELLAMLTKATKELDPLAASYLEAGRPWAHYQERFEQVSELVKTVRERLKDDSQSVPRSALREVRRAINDFRQERWANLMSLRNQLIRALFLAEFGTYVLVCVAVIAGVDRNILLSAIAFYAVGATAGLFGRFYEESRRASFPNDYGLSVTRLLATPLFSGLAGIAGPLFMSVIPVLSRPELVNAHQLFDMSRIFLIDPINLFIAAVFGLTPNLVMQSLLHQAESERPEGSQTAESRTHTAVDKYLVG